MYKQTHPYNYILGSVNGLVCFHVCLDCAYCICNPVTREYVMLPENKRIKRDYLYFSSGFGYLTSTNEYKVLELYTSRSECNIIEAVVCTVGDGNGWRYIGRLEFKFPSYGGGPGVYANGALYWKGNTKTNVLVFDLTEEKFCEQLSPPPLPQDLDYNYTIGELGGVLCYAIKFVGDRRSDIWLLKEKNDNHDTKEQVEHQLFGWRKELSLLRGYPLAFTKSGGVLCYNGRSVSVYDPIASTSRQLLEFTSYRQIFPHKNTLISLKGLGEEEINIMKSAEMEETESRDLTT